MLSRSTDRVSDKIWVPKEPDTTDNPPKILALYNIVFITVVRIEKE